MSKIQEQIHDALDRIEEKKGVNILFACEAGSRAWGFESMDSDYDVRFIYAKPQSYYMSIDENRKDVIERTIGDIDLVGWDLLKALRLFRKCNPALFEWLRSPIIYDADPDFTERMARAIPDYYSPISAWHHYRGMGKHNFYAYIRGKEEAKLKKYLYVIRPILSCIWISSNGIGLPPVVFEKLSKHTISWLSQRLIDELKDLLKKKTAGTEMGMGQYPGWYEYFEQFFSAEDHLDLEPARNAKTERLNVIFRKFAR